MQVAKGMSGGGWAAEPTQWKRSSSWEESSWDSWGESSWDSKGSSKGKSDGKGKSDSWGPAPSKQARKTPTEPATPENPGLDENAQIYTGTVKQSPNPST